jgi:hypothetical protein
MRGGGYYVRGRIKDPSTGRMKEVSLPLPHATALEAQKTLQRELRSLRDQVASRARFVDFARSLL